MSIGPIYGVSARVLPVLVYSTKRKSKTKLKKVTSSDASTVSKQDKTQLDVIDPVTLDGDPESSQSQWGDLDRFFDQQDQDDTIQDAIWISRIYRQVMRYESKWFRDPKVSLCHVTIFEALLYDALIHDRWKTIPDELKVVPVQQYSPIRLTLTLLLYRQGTELESYRVAYYIAQQKVSIWDSSDREIAVFDFVVRQNRLEEIQGTLYQEQLLLDPIWSTPNTVTSESLRFGGAKAEVFKLPHGVQTSLLNRDNKPIPFLMTHMYAMAIRKGLYAAHKQVQLGEFRITINQFFLMRWLLPFRVSISLSKSGSV